MASETPGSTELLRVGGRTYAFGLRWTSGVARSTLGAEAKSAALAEGANYVAIHRAYGQFGLALIPGVPAGLRGWCYRPRSGVAAIAANAGAATLAAFPLDDGRWLVIAIDRKGILPDGDLVVDDAEQAKARITRLIAQSPNSWRRKFLPVEWGVADSGTIDPKTLLSGAAGVKLTPLWVLADRTRIGLRIAVSALIMSALVLMALRIGSTPAPVAVVPFQAPKALPALWTPAGLTLDACLSALRQAQRYNAVPGWIPTKYTCRSGQSLVIDFSRRGVGQISLMRSLLPAAQLSDDGRAAVLAIPLDGLPRLSSIGAFAPREQYRTVGLDLSQRLNGAFTLQVGRTQLPGESDMTQPNQTWTFLNWTYQTQAPAIVWSGALARLGAISVDTLVLNPSDNLWQITGSLYASQ